MANPSIPSYGRTRSAARSAEHEAVPWVERFARFGYGAKGAVYLLVGGLGVAAAVGTGGQTTGSSGALASISDATWGRIVLAVIALGLVGYVVWQAVRVIKDPEGEGAGHRAFFALTGLIYTGLAVQAAMLALSGGGASGGGGGSGGGGSASNWSARLMQQPFGPWLLGAVGVAIFIYGLEQLWKAWQVDLDDQLDLHRMRRPARKWTVRLSRLGLAARGVVFGIIGSYVVVAAAQSDPSEARGLGGALEMLEGTPWLLGLVAFGLAAYGVYYFVRARYRRIEAT